MQSATSFQSHSFPGEPKLVEKNEEEITTTDQVHSICGVSGRQQQNSRDQRTTPCQLKSKPLKCSKVLDYSLNQWNPTANCTLLNGLYVALEQGRKIAGV